MQVSAKNYVAGKNEKTVEGITLAQQRDKPVKNDLVLEEIKNSFTSKYGQSASWGNMSLCAAVNPTTRTLDCSHLITNNGKVANALLVAVAVVGTVAAVISAVSSAVLAATAVSKTTGSSII